MEHAGAAWHLELCSAILPYTGASAFTFRIDFFTSTTPLSSGTTTRGHGSFTALSNWSPLHPTVIDPVHFTSNPGLKALPPPQIARWTTSCCR